jgi:hypothetical protein
VIEPRNNSRLASAHSSQPESSAKENEAIVLSDSAVRTRAYELYELRGRMDGSAEQDWYQAETDLRATSKHV